MRARLDDDGGARARVSQLEEGVGRGHQRQACQQKGEAAGVLPLSAPGWAEQQEVCKRELKDLLADPKSAPHLIYHGGFHYAAYLPSARVANDTSNAVTVSSPSPENSGRQTRRDGRNLDNPMQLE